MMLGNRIDHGLISYQFPPTPRATRSVRRRCSFKRKDYGQQMCAFDLLATVAGKLLLEAKDSPPLADSSSGNNQHIVVENSDKKDKLLEEKTCHERNFMFTELVSGDLDRNSTGGSEKVVNAHAEQLVNNDDCKLRLGISVPSQDVDLSDVKHSSHVGSGDGGGRKMMTDFVRNRNLSVRCMDSSSSKLGVKEPFDRKSGVLVSSIDSVKFPICKNQRTRASVPNNGDNVKLVNRDDDENDSGCFESMHRHKAYNKSPLRIGDCRLKKILVPEHGKAFADVKDSEQCSPDTEGCSYMNRERVLKRQRSIKDYPIKKRKLYDCSLVSGHEENVSNDGTYSSVSVPHNGCNGIGQCSAPITVGAISNQAHVPGGQASFQPRNKNNQVKLRIKSFRVPELHIEIPETATVGCLKRVVMEAVNSVLGGGLRVGVLLQGTKIRDDSKTLLQTGMSMDNLGFCLEPNNNGPLPINMCPPPEDSPRGILHHSPQPRARYPPISGITQNGFHQNHHPGNFDSPHSVNRNSLLNNLIERDHRDSAPPSTDMVASDKASSEPKAVVPVQAVKQEPALSAIPLRKCKRSESAQRRIRRPFTVAEVEALVQAVEKLGTGRWRDVKLRAFDRAKHRTYVDLKDKWKTLVHTARISPQQRRGEPVPQQLLDRVLTAQAYWYHQQAKQQLKSQPDTPSPSPCSLLL